MSDLAHLNDQQNMTLTQLSYCSNMLTKHRGKTIKQIREYMLEVGPGKWSEEEERFMNLMSQFPSGKNPYDHYVIIGTANNNSSGFGAVAFQDEHGNTGISYRGTDGVPSEKSMNDWIDNAIAGMTGDSDQCHEAEAFFEKYSDPNGNNYLYGHSKGGNLSEYVYVRNHEKIDGVHLLNPQPINPWSLTPEQLAAMQSKKVDIVVVEGDYVWFIGQLPSYGNIRVVDSNGGDSHSYWSINFNQDGSVSPGNHPWWEFAVLFAVNRYGYILQLPGAIFDFICDSVKTVVNAVKKGWEKCKEIAAWICDKVKKISNKLQEFAHELGSFLNKVISKAKEWLSSAFNAGYRYASANPQIVLDTYKLRAYADLLQQINRRIGNLDKRLDKLYTKVGLTQVGKLLKADILTGYSSRLTRCISYLDETANDFENAENALMKKL